MKVDNGDNLLTHCQTNHLSSFGSGYFPSPNEIDFEYVFSDFDLKVRNHIVCLLLLYLSTLCVS
jgi:hypothetical protein